MHFRCASQQKTCKHAFPVLFLLLCTKQIVAVFHEAMRGILLLWTEVVATLFWCRSHLSPQLSSSYQLDFRLCHICCYFTHFRLLSNCVFHSSCWRIMTPWWSCWNHSVHAPAFDEGHLDSHSLHPGKRIMKSSGSSCWTMLENHLQDFLLVVGQQYFTAELLWQKRRKHFVVNWNFAFDEKKLSCTFLHTYMLNLPREKPSKSLVAS